MKRYFIIIAIAIVGLLTAACGPSKQDLQWEDALKGYWKPINEETGATCTSIPFYHFGDDANGSTRYYKYSRTDTMLWEVRRKQLNIYYKEAVDGYYIGYNQYNSRSLIHIREVSDTMILVSQLFNSGYQSDYALVRITPDDYYYATSINDTTKNPENNHENDNNNTFK